MAISEKISITLPAEMLNLIKRQVQSGRYGSTSEVIRDAMRVWQREKETHEAHLALIRQRLENSARSGAPVSLDEAFAKIEAHHQNRLKQQD